MSETPKAFISYSWDSPEHRRWVRNLAARLRADGVDTTLDQWHAVPGDQLPAFMEAAIRHSDFVLSICTPKYRQRADDRAGGVGYEGDIMTAEVFVGQSQRKFIPVLRRGEWPEASPSWLLGKYYVDLRGDPYDEAAYQDLLTTLHGLRETPPPVGPRPEFPPQASPDNAYLKRLVQQYETWAQKYTPLAGIAEVRAAAQAGPRLDLPLLFMPTGFEKLVEHGFGPEKRVERVPVDDLRAAIAEHRRLVLLGEPGSGKTTTLWRLVYDYAVQAHDNPAAPLPIFVPLGGYSGPETALEYVARHGGELGSQLSAYLKAGRIVLLLDALNEMPRADYAERIGRIQALLDDYPETPVVVTCRALDYIKELDLEKLEVKPLDLTREREYLHRYLGDIEGEKLFWQLAGGDAMADLWAAWQRGGRDFEQFWTIKELPDEMRWRLTFGQREIWQTVHKDGLPPLLAMGVNPFLLVMFAQVYASRGVLPQNRGKLFAAFVDTLLERERKRHQFESWPGSATLATALGDLAYAMQRAGERGTAVKRTWAQEHLRAARCGADEALYLCASATLLALSDDQVGFVHQLIQEYFAALAWQRRFEAGDDLRQYWPQGWVEPTGWEETSVLLAGILPNMTAFVEALLPVNPPLAARCIGESGGVRPNDATIGTVQHTLVGVAKSRKAKAPERNAAGNALNWVGDLQEGVGVKEGLPNLVWCKVPAGEFVMGNTKQTDEMAWDDEAPQHRLFLPDFLIGKYPVTNAQYQLFIDDGGYTERRRGCWTKAGWQWRTKNNRTAPDRYGGDFGLPNHPVVGISWYEAVAYCGWLSEKLSDRLGQTVIVRLPSEAEWEKAARGTDGRRYPWGKSITPEHANFSDTGIRTTSAVGIFPRGESPYGLLDASGNVWEWTGSLFQPYPCKPNDGRENLEAGGTRSLRGGSWGDDELSVRCAYRVGDDPDYRSSLSGFRVVSPGFRS